VKNIFCIHLIILLGFFLSGVAQDNLEVTEAFGDRLVIGLVSNPIQEFNPFRINSPAEKEITGLIFGYGLLQKPGKMEVSNSIIDRIIYDTQNRSNLTWRVVLNRNIIFHNGSFLSNTDVKFTYDLLKIYGGNVLNRRLDFRNLKDISIEGDLEIKFELSKPEADFYEKLNDVPILSRNYYIDAENNGYKVFSENTPMGLGPFSYDFQNGTALVLDYHPNFYGGRPFLENILIEYFENETQMVDAFTNKNVDYIEVPDPVTAQEIHKLMGNSCIVFTIPRLEKKVYFILINTQKFPLNEIVVRKAIDLALNREELIAKLQLKEVANTLFDSDNPYYFKTAFRKQYDPQAAILSLREAGWGLNQRTGILEKNGENLNFNLNFSQSSYLEESVARALKISLAELGINLNPVPIRAQLKERIIEVGDFDMIVYSYTYDPDYLFEACEEFYFEILKGNLTSPNYENRYLDRLFNRSYQDYEVRERLYQRFQFYLKRESPAIFLFFNERVIVAINNRFHKFRTTFRENDRFYYRLAPFENWFVPKYLQRYSTESSGFEQ
jgi:ABC-type transport system substrate-binding protein